MQTSRYDVVILGGGNAGLGVTVPTRAAGLKVALVESWTLGGTCPNRGCTPKKVLVAAAHALDEIARAPAHGITVGGAELDWARLIAREKGMIAPFPDRFASTLEKRGVDLLRGAARFLGPQAVQVDDRVLEAEHFVVATGSTPRPLSIPGAEHLVTSDDVLSDPIVPREVVFIGGGVIALEFAHVYARVGTRVTILEFLPRLLPSLERDAVDQLVAETRRIGIRVETEAKVHRIERTSDRLRVVYEHEGKERTVEADRVVNGTGRIPNVDHLDLDVAGVARDHGRIAVDAFLRSTSNPHVCACGDVLASQQLSPIATYEGTIVGRNIAEGPRHRPEYDRIPSVVFAIPALASVGLTERTAHERGHKVKSRASDMQDWLSARTYAEPVAWSKVIVDADTDRILGAHMVGHGAEELIHFFALAIAHGITAGQLRETVYAFPTFSADIKSML
jgi:glutathione reductase (NADPH)